PAGVALAGIAQITPRGGNRSEASGGGRSFGLLSGVARHDDSEHAHPEDNIGPVWLKSGGTPGPPAIPLRLRKLVRTTSTRRFGGAGGVLYHNDLWPDARAGAVARLRRVRAFTLPR